jgi:hypothetical protein
MNFNKNLSWSSGRSDPLSSSILIKIHGSIKLFYFILVKWNFWACGRLALEVAPRA